MSDGNVKTIKLRLDDKQWWSQGVRFQCQGSGKCCTSHGEYGFVYLTLHDRQQFAKHLGLTTQAFTRQYCERTDGVWHLKERKENPDCLFLDGKRCSVYEVRPMQCRTWPFWPEVMNPKSWAKDVVSFCPGVGKGRTWSREEIETALRAQIKWDRELGT
ncbi:MAG: YkgJ family cysteine cluster protein [Bdellovibrionaceae bacterium]|nr:YkgJ family cysteine cluster protein [Pseudobdellovibrionaceae bacterium]MBX3032798.1 YkgJ family cysteine cluster protein [Pseudobdellovibrionaceae bacterium]